jgi:hypothetical protein
VSTKHQCHRLALNPKACPVYYQKVWFEFDVHWHSVKKLCLNFLAPSDTTTTTHFILAPIHTCIIILDLQQPTGKQGTSNPATAFHQISCQAM